MTDSSWRQVRSVGDLALSIREKRRETGATQGELAGIAGLGTRFVSEVENGKETAEIGKVLRLLQRLGLEVWLGPRGTRPGGDGER